MKKLEKNIDFITRKLSERNITTTVVTKAFEADPNLISIYERFPEIEFFGDSRIENLISYSQSKKKKILIRIPMQSEIQEIIRYADVSFNSEIETIKLLNEESKKQNKIHQVVLMVDMGDLREGFFYKDDLFDCVKKIKELSNIKLIGLGTNLTCYGAIIPDHQNLGKLVKLKEEIFQKFDIKLSMISGGNSSSLYLLDSDTEYLPEGINNLRIGEAFLLGRETAYGQIYHEMNQDVFTLKTELVEIKKKPSYPIGKIGVDAFGEKKEYVDVGIMRRGIVAIGRQDVNPDEITPKDVDIKILGASSDHLILDLTNTKKNYKVGEEIEFSISYGSLLSLFTSKYVKKEFL